MSPTAWLLAAALLQPALAPQQGGDEGLREAVESYWDHLLHRAKAEASQFVLPESEAHFLERQEPPFRSWELDSIEPRADGAFRVTVVASRLIQDGFYPWKVREDWVRTGEGWKVRIPDQQAARRRIWQGQRQIEPREGLLEVSPRALRLHFFSGSRTGRLYVRNGLDQPVDITALEYDRERFEVLRSPEAVEAGSVEQIVLRYRGRETAKGLQSEVAVTLRPFAGEPVRVAVPVAYNVLSRAARALLGLTAKQAEELERDDPVAPRRVIPPGIR